ncbi:hypothetical protein AAKU67_000018 [Oxalobacteraceae bacterium GrIS 2.11]
MAGVIALKPVQIQIFQCGFSFQEATYLQVSFSDAHIIVRLKIQPETRLHIKKHSQPHRGVNRNRTTPVYNLTDSAGWYIDVSSQARTGNPHRLEKFFVKNFAWVNFFQFFYHVLLLVIINNFHFRLSDILSLPRVQAGTWRRLVADHCTTTLGSRLNPRERRVAWMP